MPMNTNASSTVYLGVQRPTLHSAIDYLLARWPVRRAADEDLPDVRRTSLSVAAFDGLGSPSYDKTTSAARLSGASDGDAWDLSKLLIVLPTARAARRLAALLVERAETLGCTFVRPKIITVGELPQRLFKPELPIATEIEQTLAWSQALAETPDDELAALLSSLPPREPLMPWIELASTIRTLHEDLAAGELDFADVEREVSGDAERKRWQLLSALREKYFRRIKAASRLDPYFARSDALERKRCHYKDHLVLIGTSDLSRSVTSLLRAVVESNRISKKASTPSSVTALVAADETDRDHFDSFGSIIASQWLRRELPLRDEHLVAADDVADQASKAAKFVDQAAAKYKRSEITVGVTHESLVGPLEFELRTYGIASHRELGWTIAQTPVGRLLELLGEHLSRGTWRSLAALVRHADVYEFIERNFGNDLLDQDATNGKWLLALDNLIANHYPMKCDTELSRQATKEHYAAAAIRDLVQHSLRALRGPARLLSDWAGKVAMWLTAIYADVEKTQPDDAMSRSVQAISSAISFLQTIQKLDPTLDVKVSASSAIEMLVSRLGELRVSSPPKADEATIAGWLDLMLDDAPAIVITSLNHPFVPEAITADPFLPGSLRTRLQMSDNDRRLARDIHALEVILSCRQEIKLIVGTRSLDGSPTPPSRLLAAAAPLDAARRLVMLLERQKDAAIETRGANSEWRGHQRKSMLPIPKLPGDKPILTMSVTAFKDYLDCPYRFYLRHALRLRPLDDSSGELQANQFGDLIHNTLQWFGESELKDSTSQSEIEDALLSTLDKYTDDFFGNSPNAAVRLQFELARRRLSCVAVAQSERRRAGWRIHKVEAPFGEEKLAGVMVDGELMPIRGRIDRIDKHDDNRYAIIDYKTHGHHPRKKHLHYEDEKIHWTDLQLPLYQLLIPFVIEEPVKVESVSLSYFNIGENQSQTQINDADFTAQEFASALEKIEECVRRIRKFDFAPSDEVMFDDYSMILQTGAVATLFERLNLGDSESNAFAEGMEA